MASNKECLILVLDVRQSVDYISKQNAIKCCAEILKDKICGEKKDYVSFVLFGTRQTSNDVNSDAFPDCYHNITQYDQVQLPTWQLLMNFFKFVNTESCDEGNWMEALVVAMEVLNRSEKTLKFKRMRIVLFHDFQGKCEHYDLYDIITKNILELAELIVVSDNFVYTDNEESGEPQAVFRNAHKTGNQLLNEKYALNLVSSCNAKLCNYREAFHEVFVVENPSPWCWRSQLRIGSKIVINVSGIIAIKDESKIKLKKCWGSPEEVVSREVKFQLKNCPDELLDIDETCDLIDGYMLGGTPVPYDEMLVTPKPQLEAGLRFLGFVKRRSIPNEYFCGDSLYWLVHQKGMAASARKLDALVKALIATKRVILCWKVFSLKFNNPKIVVLLPNEIRDDKPATLSMIELAHHVQHHYWNFPALRTEKTKCSTDQIEAIDNLIDAMDLTLNESSKHRNTMKKDLLPFDKFPHIYEQNIMDMLERKIICKITDDDDTFQEMLKDKNFVEVFWKVPDDIEEAAKAAAKKVKNLFPLERSKIQSQQSKPKESEKAVVKVNSSSLQAASEREPLTFDKVRHQSPGEVFEQLIKHNVITVENVTLRDTKFQLYAAQIRDVVRDLLQKRLDRHLDVEKVITAMQVYRKNCFDFNAIADYNSWVRQMKDLITKQHHKELWRQIVEKQLGICIVGEPTLEEKVELEEFYTITGLANDSGIDHLDDNELDDLLASVENDINE